MGVTGGFTSVVVFVDESYFSKILVQMESLVSATIMNETPPLAQTTLSDYFPPLIENLERQVRVFPFEHWARHTI